LQLLRTIQEALGAQALDDLIAVREAQMRESYRAEIDNAPDLETRVARLAAIRAREGYMAEWWREGDTFVLAENHCPICAAATVCQGFCRAELNIFQFVLGSDVTVSRTEHILAGARRCAYRIQ
jgi:predicted ArsR family transcriptional regulator